MKAIVNNQYERGKYYSYKGIYIGITEKQVKTRSISYHTFVSDCNKEHKEFIKIQ